MSGAGAATPSPAPPSAPRRWLRRLLIAAATLFALSLLGTWLLQPQRLVPLILSRVGKSLALDIHADGDVDVRWRGTPQLVVRRLVVREPGAKTTLLRADRVLLALPWSTLRARGNDPVVQRIELDAPVLDVAALQTWLSKRPPSETKIPTLVDGLRIRDGRIALGGARIDGVDIDLSSLHPQKPLQTRLQGRYVEGATRVPFDLNATLSAPANDAALVVDGTLAVQRDGWRMPATVVLKGPLHVDSDGIALVGANFGASARYESGDARVPFALGLHGPLRYADGTLSLTQAGVALRGAGAMPALDAHGALALGRELSLQLDGALPRWPEDWPALPAPLSASNSPLPVSLRYRGKSDLSDVAGLSLQRDAMRFDSRFRLFDVLDWTTQPGGAPLPPLDGHLQAPRLEVSGATLEGVDVTLDDEDIDNTRTP